jgi:hypothetical protein
MRKSASDKQGRGRRTPVPARDPWLLAREAGDPVCPLCERPIPAAQRDAHHLVPRSHGGRSTEFLHRICHRQIHALFTEAELARSYASVEALLGHAEVQRFVRWVRGKPPGFSERTRKSERVRRRLRES